MSLLLCGARVLDPASGLDGVFDLRVEGDRIAAIAPPGQAGEAAQRLDLAGRLLVPGLIDIHVHLREPGDTHKEDIQSGARAAAAGGFTAVCAMANTRPPNDSVLVTSLVNERARGAACRVYPVGALSLGLEGKTLAPFAALQREGCVAISDDGRPVASGELMRRALQEAKALGLTISVHEEDPGLAGERWAMHEGPESLALGLPGLPPEAEEAMVARDLLLAERTGARLHVAHVSTARAVAMIAEAKQRGVPVTCEVTPHHLHLTCAACCGYDTNTKMAPPLRTQADVAYLQRALAEGVIDAVATDHAPHSPREKALVFEEAANGVIGLETALPLVLALVRRGVLSLARAIDALSAAPARCFGLPGGRLVEGGPADITVIDEQRTLLVSPETICSKSKNTPFLGETLQGRAILTLKGGAVTFDLDGIALRPVL